MVLEPPQENSTCVEDGLNDRTCLVPSLRNLDVPKRDTTVGNVELVDEIVWAIGGRRPAQYETSLGIWPQRGNCLRPLRPWVFYKEAFVNDKQRTVAIMLEEVFQLHPE